MIDQSSTSYAYVSDNKVNAAVFLYAILRITDYFSFACILNGKAAYLSENTSHNQIEESRNKHS